MRPIRMAAEKPQKYGAKRCVWNGIKFASQAELARYLQLLEMQKRGEISGLELQPVYVLAPAVRLLGEARKRPALRYVADFRYFKASGLAVVEDVKGLDTPASRIKRHLMATVHGIHVVLIKNS
jgi:hypothetical protein